MRILVLGNISSGKTWLSRIIARSLPDHTVVAVDEYRMRFGDGTLVGEKLAVDRFIADAAGFENVIIECTGFGPVGDRLRAALQPASAVAYIRERSVDRCLEMSISKDFSRIPYPREYATSETLDDTIRRTHGLFDPANVRAVWAEKLWYAAFIPELDEEDAEGALCLAHHQYIDIARKTALAEPRIRALILYGSAGAGSLGRLSDLDCFCISDMPMEGISSLFRKAFGTSCLHWDMLGNKATFRLQGGVLFEIVKAENLSAQGVYYSESGIQCPQSTMLKGDPLIREELQALARKVMPVKVRAAANFAELYFYLCSLFTISAKGDAYKHFFHLNIMLHRSVQLETLLVGRTEHNYLPRMSASVLPEFPWDLFLSSPTSIPLERIRTLRDYCRDLYSRLREAAYLDDERDYFHPREEYLWGDSRGTH